MKTTVLQYDPQEYDFRSLIAGFIGRDDLTSLNAEYPATTDRSGNSLYKNMEQSPLFERMYTGLSGADGKAFYALYERFVREVIRPQYDDPIYYQARPSHRILFADTPGQSRFHRDGDYGHAPGEVNYLLVQTPAAGNNAMWIESTVGLEDYRPLELEVGQYGRFKGVELSHGAMLNDTNRSRVSFDFRVIPASEAPERYRKGAENDKEGNPIRDNALTFKLCP
ncbi:hypothetical protein [Neolewinella antarctica]|uniref:2OG-Fe(II) oxygenase n=1 Tax=Neolewinella antarctica TaxID=442734 RepID=A0ABX0XB38_9BACT|nr:hypothetical protein [Neolewinella antarctica]NJC26144.1 hypothetical protein [Neolewinella antarctica]